MEADYSRGFEDPVDWVERRCSLCDGHTWVQEELNLDPVCDDCGAVVTKTSQSGLTTETDSGYSGTKPQSWSESYLVTNSTEHQVAKALELLDAISNPLYVASDIRMSAAELYGEAAVRGATDGRPVSSVVGASLILAAREHGYPIPITRVADTADIEIGYLRRLVRELPEATGQYSACASPEDYVLYICRELDLSMDTVDRAREIVREVVDAGKATGKNPVGLAAAAVYLASEEVTQRSVARAAGVTNETVRVRLIDCKSSLEGS